MREELKNIRYLKDARNAAELSTCLRRQYGAVIVKDDRPLSSGYNGSASGLEHCSDIGNCWREANHIPHGDQYEKCKAIHAEENAMYRADWVQMQGAFLYLFGMQNGVPIDARPCALCIKRIASNGILKVFCGNANGTITIIQL